MAGRPLETADNEGREAVTTELTTGPTTGPAMMKRKEVAGLMRVDERTLRRWEETRRAEGFPQPVRLSDRIILYRAEEVRAWIDKQQRQQ